MPRWPVSARSVAGVRPLSPSLKTMPVVHRAEQRSTTPIVAKPCAEWLNSEQTEPSFDQMEACIGLVGPVALVLPHDRGVGGLTDGPGGRGRRLHHAPTRHLVDTQPLSTSRVSGSDARRLSIVTDGRVHVE